MKKNAPNMNGESDSPLQSKTKNVMMNSTPKGDYESMNLDSLQMKSDEVLIESDTLAALTPRNLNQTWSSTTTPKMKSALKKTVRIQEEAIFD